jgi:hypothetical protein
MLGGRRIGINNLVRANLVGILIIIQIIIGQIRGRIINPANLALFADLDF